MGNLPKLLNSNVEKLQIYVTDNDDMRRVFIKGEHVKPGGNYNCPQSELEAQLSIRTLEKIAQAKGRYFRDEIERSENPNYMQRGLKVFIDEFAIQIANKKILDFGCGAGAFSLNLLRAGATDITGVEVDARLLEIAQSRIKDYFRSGFKLIKIGYIDGKYHMPFRDSEFDIVWPHAVMEHVLPSHRKYVLKELWRILKNEGILIIDATPNRLWIKECHTSHLFFVNYLPLSLASFIARHFSEKVPISQSIDELLCRGFRGCTYWEIKKLLPDAEWVNKGSRKELSVWMQLWKKPSDTFLKSAIKDIYGLIMKLIDPLLNTLQIPQTALLPWHFIVLRKP